MSDLDEVKLGERTKAAFEGARDTCKQILTVTTAVLTLTVAFKKDIASSGQWQWLLPASWATFVLSVLFGVAALLSLTGSLDPAVLLKHQRQPAPDKPELSSDTFGRSIYRSNIRVPFLLQLVLFVVGLAALAAFGALNM